MRAACILILTLLTAGQTFAATSGDARPLRDRPVFRRPVALAVNQDLIFTANRRTGSVSVIDPRSTEILGETAVGRQLSDIVSVRPGELLAADEAGGILLRLRWNSGWLSVTERLKVGPSPVSICLSSDCTFCTVADLWSHRIAAVSLTGPMKLAAQIDLPFAPRKQWMQQDGRTLIAADAFGGRMAMIDLPQRVMRSFRSIEGHNIRGIVATPDGRGLILSHQLLEATVPTTESNVFWGSVVNNVLRGISAEHLLQPGSFQAAGNKATPIRHWSLYALGDAGNGAGDPGELRLLPDGRAAVLLSGVDEVAFGQLSNGRFRRISVGKRPVALAASSDVRQLYVANEFDDSISVIDSQGESVSATMLLGPRPQSTQVDRGEMLFYDARLSLDGWYSCNSCHTDGHTCGQLNDNFTDRSFGTPKLVLSLLGTADTGPWAWNGGRPTLEDQIRKSITGTMQGKFERASDENVRAIAAYLRTFPPPPSLSLIRGDDVNPAAIARGEALFDQLDCAGCHKPPTYTTHRTYDVGLRDRAGLARFNPPSLRGLSQYSAFFHDARAANLREVFTRYRHPAGKPLPDAQLDDLLSFLRSL